MDMSDYSAKKDKLLEAEQEAWKNGGLYDIDIVGLELDALDREFYGTRELKEHSRSNNIIRKVGKAALGLSALAGLALTGAAKDMAGSSLDDIIIPHSVDSEDANNFKFHTPLEINSISCSESEDNYINHGYWRHFDINFSIENDSEVERYYIFTKEGEFVDQLYPQHRHGTDKFHYENPPSEFTVFTSFEERLEYGIDLALRGHDWEDKEYFILYARPQTMDVRNASGVWEDAYSDYSTPVPLMFPEKCLSTQDVVSSETSMSEMNSELETKIKEPIRFSNSQVALASGLASLITASTMVLANRDLCFKYKSDDSLDERSPLPKLRSSLIDTFDEEE